MSSEDIALNAARALLGVTADADDHELRKAFRNAAKLAHPDRPGADAARFRAVLDAYHLLRDGPSAATLEHVHLAPVTIDPATALKGGSVEAWIADRQLRLNLPAGLRAGDKVRAGDAIFRICISATDDMQVRGNDVWVNCTVDQTVLNRGGNVSIETPLGRRIVSVTERAGHRGLVRVAGQGLPARANYPTGDLFLRLEPVVRTEESAARVLLRRFAAAWAA